MDQLFHATWHTKKQNYKIKINKRNDKWTQIFWHKKDTMDSFDISTIKQGQFSQNTTSPLLSLLCVLSHRRFNSPSVSSLTVPSRFSTPQSFLCRRIIQRYFLLSSSASVITFVGHRLLHPSPTSSTESSLPVISSTGTTVVIGMSEFIQICHHWTVYMEGKLKSVQRK